MEFSASTTGKAVTQPDHLADEVFSELVDDQLAADEVSGAQAHLATCSDCQTRLDEMRAVVGLVQSLPSIEPPREFQIGPRLVADPPNVVRLRRWYAVARVSAGALAAAFVFVSVGTLYVDSRPATRPAVLSASSKAQPAPVQAPGAAGSRENANGDAPPAAVPRVAVPAASPAARAVSAPPAAGAAGDAAQSLAGPTPTSAETGDQIAAATTVRPLPTQVPTPALAPRTPVGGANSPVTSQQVEPAAPLRIAAALLGALAALGILSALLIRHRLQAVSPSHLE